MSDLVDDLRRRKDKKKKGVHCFGGEDANFDMSVLTTVRHKYTKEENFEAYKLFCIMDVDRSGLVSLRELQRVLCGDTFRTVDAEFDHPDVGITWSLDSDDCVCILRIEAKSPASKNRNLINGLRLYQINDMKMKMHQKRSLEKLQHELIRIHDDPVDLKFVEPLFIITKMTCSLDIQVYGRTYTAWLPIGAVNSVTVMEQNIRKALFDAHSDFKHIDVRINRKTLSVTFFCPDFQFSLQFGTGPNFQSSCRYAIGFSAFDTPVSKRHIGHDTTISLNLGLGDTEMDILMAELFGIFDVDGSGEFQYEEFRDFHSKLLANEDSVEILQAFARFRFEDIKKKAKLQELVDDRRKKMKRRFLLREKNKDIHDKQRAKRAANSTICGDGVSRRTYAERKQDHIRISSAQKLSGKAVGSSKTANKKVSAIHKDREIMKERKRLQDLARQRKLNELAEINREQVREVKRLERDLAQKSAKIHMAEVLHVLRKVYSKGFTQQDTDIEGMGAMGILQDKIITPALRVSSNMFTDNAGVDDIDLEEMDCTEIHPAAGKYFFMREPQNEKYNVHCRHPTFFGCDYAREASRHSSFAMGVCRATLSQRQTPMSRVTIVKHPMLLARIEEIDRIVVANKLSEIVTTIETFRETAEKFVKQVLFNVTTNAYGGSSHEVLRPSLNLTDDNDEESFDLMRAQYGDTSNDVDSTEEETGVLFINDNIHISASKGTISNESCSLHEHGSESEQQRSETGVDTSENNYADEEHVDCDVLFIDNDKEVSQDAQSEVSVSSNETKEDEDNDRDNDENSMGRELFQSTGKSNSDSDSDSETTAIDQSSSSLATFVARPRTETMRQQRSNVYNGLNNTLATQLSLLTDQIQQLSKQKERKKAAQSEESIEEKRLGFARYIARNSILDGSLSYLRLCGIITQRYALELKYDENLFEADTSILRASIYHNTATVLVQALCNFAVNRVVDATKDMCGFWGADKLDIGEESDENSVEVRLKSQPRRQGTVRDLINITAAPAAPSPLQKRRTGLVLKRMSSVASNNNHKFGGEYDDDDDSSVESGEGGALDDVELPKNFVMGVHAITSCEVISEDLKVISLLRSVQPRIRAKITHGKWKVYSYDCDSLRNKQLALQPDLSVGSALTQFAWSSMDIEDKDLWNGIELKNHQEIHLFCTDGSSRVDNVICEGVLTFAHIKECHEKFVKEYQDERRLKKAIIDSNVTWDESNEHKPFNVPLIWKCSSAVGENVHINAVVNMTIRMHAGNWIFPPRDDEYWRSKRSQHWTTYPLVPTSTGIVRQKFRDIATEYDKMKLIHPAFWGFSVRWKGPSEDEVRFVHPMFRDFSMVKKPTSQGVLEEIDLNARKKIKVNPFKWKPIHECKVCYANVPGCPRCWEMPLKKSGERFRPVEFQYDPDLAVKKANEEKVKQAMQEQKKKAKVDAMRALRAAGELDYDSDDTVENSVDTNSLIVDPDEVKEVTELHTQLTTEYALELYRKRAQKLMTVYVKIAPGGYVRRLVVDPEDTIWHLHNMVRSHSDCGSVRGAQFVLPTNVAFFECDADIIPESEYLGSRVTANIKLKDYGLRAEGGTITILYLPRYKETTIIPLMKRFMQDNMDITGMNMDLPVLSYINDIPEALEKDDFQMKLSIIMKRQYNNQEMLNLARLKSLGAAHRIKMQQNYSHFVEKKKLDILQASRERKEFERLMEKKLKGLVGQEREDRRRQLMDAHFSQSAGTEEDRKRAAKVKKDAERAEKLRKKRDLLGQGLLSTSDSTSKVKNVISNSISQVSASTMSKEEEDFKNKMVSFVEETSQSLHEFEDNGVNRQRVKVPPLLLQSKDDDGSVISATTFVENDLSEMSKSLPNLKENLKKR